MSDQVTVNELFDNGDPGREGRRGRVPRLQAMFASYPRRGALLAGLRRRRSRPCRVVGAHPGDLRPEQLSRAATSATASARGGLLLFPVEAALRGIRPWRMPTTGERAGERRDERRL